MNTTSATTNPTVLVVDDVPMLCEVVARALRSSGYRVLVAANGSDALELARAEEKIDLLFTDIEMPGMRGDELARRFVVLHPEAALLFASSVTNEIDAPQPFEFLAKPFSVSVLNAAVTRAVETRHAVAGLM